MTGLAGVLLCLAALQVSQPASALPARVIGIIVSAADSACVIRCSDTPGRWGLFRMGQRACDVAEVQEIRRDRVVVKDVRTNRSETLMIAAATPGIRPAGVSPAIAAPETLTLDVPKASIERYLTNLPEVLSSALATPRTRELGRGQQVIDGFGISQIRPGGAADQLGLKDGDVILEVNGEPLDGMPTIMRLLAQLGSATQTTLAVLRDGQRMTLVFNSR